MLKIVTIPNSVLTETTKKVEQFDGSLAKLVKDMDQALSKQLNPQGVGLAAPQVAENLAIFIIKPTPDAKTEVFVNPKIISTSEVNVKHENTLEVRKTLKKKKTKLEGCLSIPKIWGAVKRSDKLYLEFQNQTGRVYKKWFSGFKSVIIQHEIDHLRGVLFTQRALEQNAQLYEEKEGKLKKLLTK